MTKIPSSINNRFIRFAFVVCFFFVATLGAEKTAQLQFLPNTPVYLNSDLKLDFTQSLPGLTMTTRGLQNLNATLTVTSENPGLRITQPPFQLNFTLKGLKINLKANGEEIIFDSNDRNSSLYLTQVNRLIDRPIYVDIDENFTLKTKSDDFDKMVQELPVLKEINPENMLVELFLHHFALGGEELTVGKTIARDFGDIDASALPEKVEYTITEIDDYSITADIRGILDKKEIELTGLGLNLNSDKEQESIFAKLNGSLNGQIKWNRDNAMLYTMDLNYGYSVKFKVSDWEWMMTIDLDLKNRTTRKAEKG